MNLFCLFYLMMKFHLHIKLEEGKAKIDTYYDLIPIKYVV